MTNTKTMQRLVLTSTETIAKQRITIAPTVGPEDDFLCIRCFTKKPSDEDYKFVMRLERVTGDTSIFPFSMASNLKNYYEVKYFLDLCDQAERVRDILLKKMKSNTKAVLDEGCIDGWQYRWETA